jgi:hypothetical protein
VSSAELVTTELAAEPGARFLLLIVTVDGTEEPMGDALGGVAVGAGNFERAECTRASSRCICAVSERMCDSEFDVGSF